MQMSSYKGHGTGVKNLYEIIAILNRHNRNKISIVYKDDLSTEAIPGTEVTVTIPLNYKYEY
jgi:hypothetical protein